VKPSAGGSQLLSCGTIIHRLPEYLQYDGAYYKTYLPNHFLI